MRRTSLAAVVVALAAAAGVAQTPPTLLPESVAPPPPTIIADPPPTEVVEVVEVVSPVETLVAPRLVVSADFGPAFGGWGLWRKGTLAPTQLFARPQLFPVPIAEFDHTVTPDTALAARVGVSYKFERMPLTVTGSWETYHRNAETRLLGYDPLLVPHLSGINRFNEKKRQGTSSYSGQDAYLQEYADSTSGADHRQYPRVQMRSVPSEPHWLQSRVSANVTDFTLAYQLWAPPGASGAQIHLLAGGRYGGFFADDRASGDVYEQSASNWFGGFGPHGGLRIEYRFWPQHHNRIGSIGFWWDTRGGALVGQITQRFREFDPVNGGAEPFREQVLQTDRTVPFIASEFGISARGRWCEGSIGVRYSQYWGIGDIGASRLDFAAVALVFGVAVGF